MFVLPFYLPIFHFCLPVTSIKTCVELPPLQNRKTSSVSVSNGVVQAAELVPVLASAHQIKACLQSCLYSYKMLVESICHIMILLCKYHMILHNVWYTNIIYESLYVILCYYNTLYSIIYLIIFECIICILISINHSLMTNSLYLTPPYFNHPKKTAVFFPTRISLHPRPSENCIEDLLRREGIPPEAFSVLLAEFDVCFHLKHRVWWILFYMCSSLKHPPKIRWPYLYSYSKLLKGDSKACWRLVGLTIHYTFDGLRLNHSKAYQGAVNLIGDERCNCWWKKFKSSSPIWDV